MTVVTLEVVVYKTLAAPLGLNCDFCDRSVDAIRPRHSRVALLDGSSVPFVGRPWQRARNRSSRNGAPLPPSLQYVPPGIKSTILRVAELTKISSRTEKWVSVTTEQRGPCLLHHLPSQLEKNGLFVARGVALVEKKNLSR